MLELIVKYLVHTAHRSEYPDPIRFERHTALVVGERYEGPEGWDDWYFCSVTGHAGGWVPAQLIEHLPDGGARAVEAYSARELDVDPGDALRGQRELNGWAWCERQTSDDAGWVPLANLTPQT